MPTDDFFAESQALTLSSADHEIDRTYGVAEVSEQAGQVNGPSIEEPVLLPTPCVFPDSPLGICPSLLEYSPNMTRKTLGVSCGGMTQGGEEGIPLKRKTLEQSRNLWTCISPLNGLTTEMESKHWKSRAGPRRSSIVTTTTLIAAGTNLWWIQLFTCPRTVKKRPPMMLLAVLNKHKVKEKGFYMVTNRVTIRGKESYP